jgi:hypothetical protein
MSAGNGVKGAERRMTAVNEVNGNKDSKITIIIMGKNNQTTRSIEKDHKQITPRIIVVGTGFHRQVLGRDDSPLSSWSKLLECVSKNYKKDSKYALGNDPVMLWEDMVLEIANRHKNDKTPIQAFKAELMLKTEVCDLLKRHSSKSSNIKIFKRNIICDNFFNRSTHLLSLNFDKLLCNNVKTKNISLKNCGVIQEAKSKGIRKKDAKLLYDRTKCLKDDQESTVWHPHGHIDCPESLVMGMRDYGFLPLSYFYAFNLFKAWENEVAGNLQGAEKYEKLIQVLIDYDKQPGDQGNMHAADNWVTRFMLYPISFIGVGLSQVEIGMRWLLVQRARNFRKLLKTQMPATEFYGTTNPEIPGLTWKGPDMKIAYDQMWKSALGS